MERQLKERMAIYLMNDWIADGMLEDNMIIAMLRW